MKRTLALVSSLVFIALASCSLPAGGRDVFPTQQQWKSQTASTLWTPTSQVEKIPSRTPGPAQRETTTPSMKVTFTPAGVFSTPTRNQPQASVPTPVRVPCDLAQAGRPIDVTIPDDTLLKPGENFSKTWRLVNIGSCTWDHHYALVWFSGAELGISHIQPYNGGVVLPGQSADFTIEMVAPRSPGVYQSNWKLRNAQGIMFGIGPEGNSPFWVRIVVATVDTPVPTPAAPVLPPLSTSTPGPSVSGVIVLNDQVGLDVDSGKLGTGEAIDLLLDWPEGQPGSLAPLNGAVWLPLDSSQSGAGQCMTGPTMDKDAQVPILLQDLSAGAALCMRSDHDLPGLLLITHINPAERQVTVEFMTWIAP